MSGEDTGERRHQIRCHVLSSGWSVTFTDIDHKTRIGPWLLCESHDEVLKILTWGTLEGLALEEHYRDIARWGTGGGTLHLTSRQRHQLIARGQGWPWNGYELLKMKEAGCYPSKPLSPSQEEAFMRRRSR